jgi:phage terminase large subunit
VVPVRAWFDIGGAGAKADACAIWITQWTGRDILVLDYIEGQGQVIGYYVELMREKKWRFIRSFAAL